LKKELKQTSDVPKTFDVFLQGEHCLSRRISPDEVFPRHRMSGRHPMSNRDESRWGEQTQKWCFRSSNDVGATGRSPLQVSQTSDVSKTSDVF
jgi:hypothetical protein